MHWIYLRVCAFRMIIMIIGWADEPICGTLFSSNCPWWSYSSRSGCSQMTVCLMSSELFKHFCPRLSRLIIITEWVVKCLGCRQQGQGQRFNSIQLYCQVQWQTHEECVLVSSTLTHTLSLVLTNPWPRGSLGNHRWFHNQFPPFFSLLHCPLGLGELQACPFPDVVFPPLPLSALSSSETGLKAPTN